MRQTAPELSETYRAEGLWRDRLLVDYFEDAVAAFPDKTAVLDERFGGLTYLELEQTALRLAAALRARGVSKGDNFVIALPNWHQVSAFVLALGYLGAVTVHMPITGREREFGGVLDITRAKGIVVPAVFRDHDFVSMLDALPRDTHAPTLRVAVAADEAPLGWVTYDQLLAEGPADALKPQPAVTAEDLTSLLFTSGSSGAPKGVMHSANSLCALNTSVAPLYGLGPDDVIFMGAPLGYSAGLVHGVRLALFLGAKLVLQESWNGERAVEIMAREGATFTLTTPTLLQDLLDSAAFAEHGEHLRLRLIFCGGSYVPSDLLGAARDKLPSTLTSVIWGMTEGIGSACRPGTPAERVVGTDGQPYLGTELKVLREDGSDAAVDEEGDLVMRGPQLFLGYYERPELDAECFVPGGWFRTGDVARIDAEGYVKITGRRKELIIRGGVNISPAEIEAELIGDPRIRQLAVVDMPDRRLGERVCACVVPNEGQEDLTLADAVEIARRRGLAKHKWPERLELLESLPLTPAGKLQRTAVRELVRARLVASKADNEISPHAPRKR